MVGIALALAADFGLRAEAGSFVVLCFAADLGLAFTGAFCPEIRSRFRRMDILAHRSTVGQECPTYIFDGSPVSILDLASPNAAKMPSFG